MSDVLEIVARRVVSGLVILLILATAIFFLVRLVGDPVSVLAGVDPTPQQLAATEVRLGMDKPLWDQYLDYLSGMIRLDGGESWLTGQSVTEMVSERFPATLQLSAVAIVLAALIAVPVGVWSALKAGSLSDTASRVLAVVGQSMPVFWLGILVIMVFAVNLGWFPAGGRATWRNLVLPGVTLSVYAIPLTMRLTRSSMLEVMNEDYIRTARSKGVSSRRVTISHGFRNALIPVITVIALRTGHVLSGAIVLEEVFAYPGIGQLMVAAMVGRDFPVIQFSIIFIAVVILVVNLLADLMYKFVDPRVSIL